MLTNLATRRQKTAKTETDSASELAFKSCGYVEVGKIPNFSRTSVDAATKRGFTLFYKEILLQTQQSRTTAGA